jgi:hypothetical protein
MRCRGIPKGEAEKTNKRNRCREEGKAVLFVLEVRA